MEAGDKKLIVMNIDGFGQVEAQSRRVDLRNMSVSFDGGTYEDARSAKLKKESCLLLSFAAMRSSVLLYLYSSKLLST